MSYCILYINNLDIHINIANFFFKKEIHEEIAKKPNHLSFGVNRRRTEYKNHGNQLILIEKPAERKKSVVCVVT